MDKKNYDKLKQSNNERFLYEKKATKKLLET